MKTSTDKPTLDEQIVHQESSVQAAKGYNDHQALPKEQAILESLQRLRKMDMLTDKKHVGVDHAAQYADGSLRRDKSATSSGPPQPVQFGYRFCYNLLQFNR